MGIQAHVMLSQVPLFAQLSQNALSGLHQRVRLRRYGKGGTIFYQGDPGSCLFIVQTGRVKLRVSSPEGRKIIIDLLEPGDVFVELESRVDGFTVQSSLEQDEVISTVAQATPMAVKTLCGSIAAGAATDVPGSILNG